MRNRFSSISRGSVSKKYIKYFVIFVVIVVAGLFVKNSLASVGSTSSNSGSEKNVLAKAVSSKEIGKEVPVSISDENGDSLEGVRMRIDNAELRNEIIVQGQKATSVAGRSFLVLNLKIVNELEQGVEINTRDYFRLAENDESSEWLAPDIHNDPVVVQAISTKPTRVAFPVNAGTRHFILQTGEITGDKEKLEIDL